MDARIRTEVDILQSEKTTVAEKIAAAARLWELQEDIKVALEGFKGIIRELPEVRDGDPNKTPTVTIDGEDFTRCKVTLPHPTLVLNGDVKPSSEFTSLGKDVFDHVYRLQLRTTDPRDLNSLPAPVRKHLHGQVSITQPPARVSVRNMGASGITEIK